MAMNEEEKETEAIILLQARYVLRDLNFQYPECGYKKMADACERAANRIKNEETQN